MGLVWMAIAGLITGFVARAIVPGKDPMNWWQTIVLGVVGSYVGGAIFALLPGGRSPLDPQPTNFIGAVIGAIVALLVWRRIKHRI